MWDSIGICILNPRTWDSISILYTESETVSVSVFWIPEFETVSVSVLRQYQHSVFCIPESELPSPAAPGPAVILVIQSLRAKPVLVSWSRVESGLGQPGLELSSSAHNFCYLNSELWAAKQPLQSGDHLTCALSSAQSGSSSMGHWARVAQWGAGPGPPPPPATKSHPRPHHRRLLTSSRVGNNVGNKYEQLRFGLKPDTT